MDGFHTNKKTVELQLTKLLANSYYFKHNLTPGTLLTHFSSSHHYYAIISRCRLSDTHISTQEHTKHTHTDTFIHLQRHGKKRRAENYLQEKTWYNKNNVFNHTHTHNLFSFLRTLYKFKERILISILVGQNESILIELWFCCLSFLFVKPWPDFYVLWTRPSTPRFSNHFSQVILRWSSGRRWWSGMAIAQRPLNGVAGDVFEAASH